MIISAMSDPDRKAAQDSRFHRMIMQLLSAITALPVYDRKSAHKVGIHHEMQCLLHEKQFLCVVCCVGGMREFYLYTQLMICLFGHFSMSFLSLWILDCIVLTGTVQAHGHFQLPLVFKSTTIRILLTVPG